MSLLLRRLLVLSLLMHSFACIERSELILPNKEELERKGVIDCRSRLVGMLKYYYRKAA